MGKKLHKRMNGEEVKIHQHDNYQMPGAYKQDGDKNKNQPMFNVGKPYDMGMSMRGPLDKRGRHSDEKYDAKMAFNHNLTDKARMHYLENDIADHKGPLSLIGGSRKPKTPKTRRIEVEITKTPKKVEKYFQLTKTKTPIGPNMEGPLDKKGAVMKAAAKAAAAKGAAEAASEMVTQMQMNRIKNNKGAEMRGPLNQTQQSGFRAMTKEEIAKLKGEEVAKQGASEALAKSTNQLKTNMEKKITKKKSKKA